jgi:DNA mismatch endonuclease (patch repair protein)
MSKLRSEHASSAYPIPKDAAVTAVMRANRKTNSGPERRIRSRLHAAGLRYRIYLSINVEGQRIRPDIVFTRRKLAVFVDGCFWHACPDHGTMPSHNPDYWLPKLGTNVRRDRLVDGLLRQAGWRVLRIWEHTDSAEAAQAIALVAMEIQAVDERVSNWELPQIYPTA